LLFAVGLKTTLQQTQAIINHHSQTVCDSNEQRISCLVQHHSLMSENVKYFP